MKKLILLLLFIPLVSFGQISISDLIKVGKMDMESFEIYALEKGYRFEDLQNTDSNKGLKMKKSNGSRAEFLTLYSNPSLVNVKYKGPVQERLVSKYKELKSLGFKIYRTFEWNDEKIYVKEYERSGPKNYVTERLQIEIYSDGIYCEIHYQYFL
tara:strand:- start:3485 stop:3949 length:465 start_codon:yes stop_codon:yes gene_type:complete